MGLQSHYLSEGLVLLTLYMCVALQLGLRELLRGDTCVALFLIGSKQLAKVVRSV